MGPAGEGGDDASGGTTSSGATGGTSGGSEATGGSSTGTGAAAGTNGTSGAGGSPAGGSGNPAGGSGGLAGSATGSGGSGPGGGGGTPNTAGTSSGGSAGQVGGCDNQLLVNANFDAGPTASWRQEADLTGIELIVRRNDADLMAAGVAPHSGDYLAWLGGIEDNQFDHHTTILRQDVTIPAEANTLTLSGRYWIITEDSPTVAYDEAYLEFEDDEGTIWQALPLTNTLHTTGWTAFEEYTNYVDRLAGRTVTFVAYSRTDPEGKTSFFLDSLRLEASCGR
jgi:hypothetical protein